MKKQWISYVGIIATVVMVVGLSIGFAITKALSNTVIGSLSVYSDKVSYVSDGYQDYSIYRKYIYKNPEKVKKKLKDNKFFMPVTNEDVAYIESYFDNFEEWIEGESFYAQYDFKKSCIDEGDYFYIENKDTYEKYANYENEYWAYNVYFFDVQTMTLYFIHNNI